MRKPLIIITLALFALHSVAQCVTDEYNKILVGDKVKKGESYIDYIESFRVSEEGQSSDLKTKKEVRTIPVVFHIVHSYDEGNISKAQIEDQMRILNEDFQKLNADTSKTRSMFKDRAANLNLEFKLATIAPDGSCTEGITRTYDPEHTVEDYTDNEQKIKVAVPIWDRNKYLNIWVIEAIESDGQGTILGYAQFPGQNASTDGIVMRHDRVGTIGTANIGDRGRTLTHEIGHWLSLFHPFQGGCSTNNNRTDRVDDTPPVKEPSYGCPLGGNTCSNDNPNEVDNVENFMDYANGSCMNMFTNGQKARVESTLATASLRGTVVSATNLQATGVNVVPNCGPKADFWVEEERTVICQGGNLTFQDLSYNGDVIDRTWTFQGGTPSVSTFENPTVVYNTPGVYEVTLSVGNTHGNGELKRSAFVTVLPSTADKSAPYGEDFKSSSSISAWELEQEGEYGWSRTTTVGYSGNQSLVAVIDDETAFGSRYSLTMPPLNVKDYGAPLKLTYKYAYARRQSPATEVLYILTSEDCGTNWRTLKVYNANNGLSTGTESAGWRPNSKADWGHNEIDLSQFSNSENLMVRFDVLSQSGNPVYLDNINIGAYALNVEDEYYVNEPLVYPNPAQNVLNLDLLGFNGTTSLEIFDITGKTVFKRAAIVAINTIDISSIPNGAYTLKISLEDKTYNKKLIINR